MKEDAIKKAMKASQLEPSMAFVPELMRQVAARQQRKLRIRLYGLAFGIGVFFVGIALWLTASGFELTAFGEMLVLPRVGTMVMLSAVGSLLVFHVAVLLRMGRREVLPG